MTKSHSPRLEAMARYIESHADESLPLSRLARQFNLSPAYVQKLFKAAYGLSPKDYQNALRLKQVKAALKAGDSIAGAIYEAGYGSLSRIYEQVDGRIGMSLSSYRAGGRGEAIAYALRLTALGLIIMAATDRGVCYIHFGESPDSLVAGLEQEYPKATISPSSAHKSPELDLWITVLDQHLSHGAPCPDVPLHLNGTAFQMRVWRFLMSVESGDVKSYRDVAKAIGRPKAIRAAASACAANNIAVLVPCHRILRQDGGLGGYRWGLERKRTLLDREHQTTAGRAD